jgi:Lon protease-like protein
MLAPRPYPFGEIVYLDDGPVELDDHLRRAIARVSEAFPAYFQLALALTDQWARPFHLPQDPHQLVNSLAPWIKADEAAKQRLLEIEEASARVDFLAELLSQLLREASAEVAQRRRLRFSGLGAQN